MKRAFVCALLLGLIHAACSHEDELSELERSRRPVEPGPDDTAVIPPPPCVTFQTMPGMQIGAARDAQPASPSVEVVLALSIAPSCASSTLHVGLCEHDFNGVPIAPAAWQTDVSVEPGRQYSPVVSLPDKAGTQMPCVSLDQLYAVSVERVCDGDEVLCSADGACHRDTSSDPKHCGPSCTECRRGDQGAPICVMGECELKCAEGYRYEATQCRPRPGCKGLETACQGEDCCAIDLISAGEGLPLRVKRGYDASDSPDGLPEFQPSSTTAVNVTPFYLDRYEVTVARYRQFVNAYESWIGAANPREGHGEHPNVPGSGWAQSWTRQRAIEDFATPIYLLPPTRAELVASLVQPSCGGFATWSETPGKNDNLPINCINFYMAYLYCVWDGESVNSRLPTEAEWNAAAAGGEKQRAYPWSDPPSSRDVRGRVGLGSGDRLPYEVGTSPTGKGLWGTHDLAGNVWEWVRDTSREAATVTYIDHPSDPIDLTNDLLATQAHVLRGGSFKDFSCIECEAASRLRTPARQVLRPYRVFNDIGFRCARNFR